MNPQEAFVTRLRRQRERNHVSLDAIARDTRIRRELLDAFEENDLSGWPSGVYARSWIRSYAAAVGLDPSQTVDEFCRVFPRADRRGQASVEQIAAAVALASEFHDEFAGFADRRAAAANGASVQKPEAERPFTLIRALRAVTGRLHAAFGGTRRRGVGAVR
jgi:hypothetical protein